MARKNDEEAWPFDQAPNVVAVTLARVVFAGSPILYVSHDAEDHGWQFLDDQPFTTADAALVSMKQIVKVDPTVVEVADLPPGWIAERSSVGDHWHRKRSEDAE